MTLFSQWVLTGLLVTMMRLLSERWAGQPKTGRDAVSLLVGIWFWPAAVTQWWRVLLHGPNAPPNPRTHFVHPVTRQYVQLVAPSTLRAALRAYRCGLERPPWFNEADEWIVERKDEERR